MPSFIDLTGQKFGRLTVKKIAYRKRTKRGDLHIYWECHCDCGSVCAVRPDGLKGGTTRSCGCLQKELTAKQGRKNATHGMRHTPEYNTHQLMKRRCYEKTNEHYKYYGSRGIKVCDRWLESFENFYEDMGPRPTKRHSLGRIDNDKGYCPENCRWETPKQQMNNISTNYMININGFERTLTQWCDHFKIDYYQVYQRITKYGWDPIKALTTPFGFKYKKTTINGETKPLKQWAEHFKIGYSTVKYRVNAGWDPHKALTTPVKSHRKK